MRVVQRKVADLIPYVGNARMHSSEQIDQLADSINEYGFTNPILIDPKNEIIAGHGRLLAAKQLDMVKVPALILSGLTPEQKKAYVIADNKLAMNAEWDYALLKAEFEALAAADFTLALTGFDPVEIGNILGSDDDIDDPNAEWSDMPEFQHSNRMPVRSVIVHFIDKDDVQKFSQLIEQNITDKTKSLWYPRQPVLGEKEFVYSAEADA